MPLKMRPTKLSSGFYKDSVRGELETVEGMGEGRRCALANRGTPPHLQFRPSSRRHVAGGPSSERGEPGGTSGSTHGLGYLFTAFRRQGLIADKLVLQLTTFLRSLDLFLELIVLTPGTLTANQVRHSGKQGTDNPELSRIHSSACLSTGSTPAKSPA
jgi:hypothetical protein